MTAHVSPGLRWGGQPAPAQPGAPAPLRQRLPSREARIRALLLAAVVASVLVVSRFAAGPSYGPPSASDLQPTLAPGVVAEVLPSHRSLGDRRFEDFDVSPDGAVAVVTGGHLFDLLGGDELVPPDTQVRSVAFAGGALAIADDRGRIGYFDEDRFVPAGPSPVRSPRLAASGDGSRLLVFATSAASAGGGDAALAEIEAGRPAEIRSGAGEPLLAASADDLSIVFSIGDCLFRMTRGDRPRLVLRAPDPAARLVGVALADGAVYFSTERAVYALEDGFALPLAIGIGGPLRVHERAIFILDASTGRIFRLVRGDAAPPSPAALSPRPPPDPPPEAALDRTLAAVKLRDGPNLKSNALRELPAGTTVRVIREARGGWLEVELEGERGYVHMSRLGRCDPERGDLDCRWLQKTCVDRQCR